MNTVTGTDLKIDFINNPERLAELRKFAAEFDHEIPASNHPLMAFRFGNRGWHSYMQIYQGPVIFSAWHTDPKICSQRDTIETIKHIHGWLKIQHGGGIVSVPKDSKTFTPETMLKLGLERLHAEIYKSKA